MKNTNEPLPIIAPDGEGMKLIGQLLKEMLPQGVGFALLTFEFNNPGLANYISSAQREDMIKALRECADRIEGNRTIQTPNQN